MGFLGLIFHGRNKKGSEMPQGFLWMEKSLMESFVSCAVIIPLGEYLTFKNF